MLAGGCQKPTIASQAPGRVAVGALQGRTQATLTVVDAASRVQVIMASLPGMLYRISTPPGAGLEPHVAVAGPSIRAELRPTGTDGPHEVRIVLNRDVRWGIRLPEGAGEQQLDLVRGRITRVELGASGLVELRLPRPVGTVPVTLRGAVGTLSVTAPQDTPLRVGLDRGAGSATTPWTVAEALPAGTYLGPAIWTTARHRYALRAREGIGFLTVRRNGTESGRPAG
ncbi:hypothetical protein Ade02nite_44380 [Paractinoplanes deccanensis]|uniref:Lipoprotein n=2 Tax=Paractinoplanes deccanensis TaxID=113561 RepID=A0ABQ3Y728_9ACTN|nr:hypothetical protein Ade02nite_44380 [Actinoplanes deccanensis]